MMVHRDVCRQNNMMIQSGDHRTDIYALGCLGVFLLTGEDAFKENFLDIMTQKPDDPPPALKGNYQ